MGSHRYFMAPAGIIKPEEVPSGWGLVEVCGKVSRIVKGGKTDHIWALPDGKYPFESNSTAEKGLLTSLVRRLRDGETTALRIATRTSSAAARELGITTTESEAMTS